MALFIRQRKYAQEGFRYCAQTASSSWPIWFSVVISSRRKQLAPRARLWPNKPLQDFCYRALSLGTLTQGSGLCYKATSLEMNTWVLLNIWPPQYSDVGAVDSATESQTLKWEIGASRIPRPMFLETSESRNNHRQGKTPKHWVDIWKMWTQNKYKGIGFDFESKKTWIKK